MYINFIVFLEGQTFLRQNVFTSAHVQLCIVNNLYALVYELLGLLKKIQLFSFNTSNLVLNFKHIRHIFENDIERETDRKANKLLKHLTVSAWKP